MDKAPDAFRTISEVADDLDVPQHVLRFWETRFAQIKPMKRAGGRRYYRADDVELLRGIRHLLYGQGYTIRGVQRLLKDRGSRYVQSLGKSEGANGVPPLEADEADPLVLPHEVPAPAAEREGAELPVEGARREPEPAFDGTPRGEAMLQPVREPGLSEEDRARLEAVLADLVACRAVLEAALRED